MDEVAGRLPKRVNSGDKDTPGPGHVSQGITYSFCKVGIKSISKGYQRDFK